MLHLCKLWFSKLLIALYLAHWLFLGQSGTCRQHGTHKWYAIRKSLGTTALETSKMRKIMLSKLKFIKISESVMPHQTLFQHQLGHVQHLTRKAIHTKSDKHHLYFWNLIKYKTKREKCGGHSILYPHPLKYCGGERPLCSPPDCVHDANARLSRISTSTCPLTWNKNVQMNKNKKNCDHVSTAVQKWNNSRVYQKMEAVVTPNL